MDGFFPQGKTFPIADIIQEGTNKPFLTDKDLQEVFRLGSTMDRPDIQKVVNDRVNDFRRKISEILAVKCLHYYGVTATDYFDMCVKEIHRYFSYLSYQLWGAVIKQVTFYLMDGDSGQQLLSAESPRDHNYEHPEKTDEHSDHELSNLIVLPLIDGRTSTSLHFQGTTGEGTQTRALRVKIHCEFSNIGDDQQRNSWSRNLSFLVKYIALFYSQPLVNNHIFDFLTKQHRRIFSNYGEPKTQKGLNLICERIGYGRILFHKGHYENNQNLIDIFGVFFFKRDLNGVFYWVFTSEQKEHLEKYYPQSTDLFESPLPKENSIVHKCYEQQKPCFFPDWTAIKLKKEVYGKQKDLLDIEKKILNKSIILVPEHEKGWVVGIAIPDITKNSIFQSNMIFTNINWVNSCFSNMISRMRKHFDEEPGFHLPTQPSLQDPIDPEITEELSMLSRYIAGEIKSNNNEPLPIILLIGPPGIGKRFYLDHLRNLIASELGIEWPEGKSQIYSCLLEQEKLAEFIKQNNIDSQKRLGKVLHIREIEHISNKDEEELFRAAKNKRSFTLAISSTSPEITKRLQKIATYVLELKPIGENRSFSEALVRKKVESLPGLENYLDELIRLAQSEDFHWPRNVAQLYQVLHQIHVWVSGSKKNTNIKDIFIKYYNRSIIGFEDEIGKKKKKHKKRSGRNMKKPDAKEIQAILNRSDIQGNKGEAAKILFPSASTTYGRKLIYELIRKYKADGTWEDESENIKPLDASLSSKKG